MTSFNAGVIEATLDVDRDPFQRGLELAQAEGKRFAGQTFKARVDLDTTSATRKAAQLQRQLQALERVWKPKIDKSLGIEATRQGRAVQKLTDQLGQLDRVDANPSVDVRGIAAASAELAAFDQQLDALERDQTVATIGVGGIGGSSQQTIDRFSGRLGILLKLALALGPALIPIGAVGVPAVTGLSAQLGFAAVGAGSLLAAMAGVPDAIAAVQEYSLEPTAENAQAAADALSKLPLEAQRFVAAFQEFRPVLDDLRDAAGAGWFPGLTAALDPLERAAPRVASMLEAVGTTGGDLVNQAAEAVAGPGGQRFLTFVQANAPQALDELGQAVGNVLSAMGELWMTFDPVNDDFSAWLLGQTEDLQAWSQQLGQTAGFREFVSYIEETGPQVAATLSAIGDAFLQILEGASPIAGPILKVLEVLATSVATLADTGAGSALLQVTSGLAAINLALKAYSFLGTKLGAGGLLGPILGTGAAGGAGSPVAGAMGLKQAAGIVGGQLTTITTAQDRARMSGAQLEEQNRRSAAAYSRLGSAAATLGKTAGVVGAFAAVSSGMADDVGLQNTAMLTAAGTMAGPWGAAVGAGIGLFMDLAGGAQAATESIETYAATTQAAIGAGDQAGIAASNQALNTEAMDYASSLDNPFSLSIDDQMTRGSSLLSEVGDFFGVAELMTDQYQAALDDAAATSSAAETAVLSLAGVLGGQFATAAADGSLTAQEYADVTSTIGPMLADMGLTINDYAALTKTAEFGLPGFDTAAQAQLDQINAGLEDQIRIAESAAGKADGLARAWSNLDAPGITAAQSAQGIATALSAMIDPQLAAVSAADQWTLAMRSLGDETQGANIALRFNTDAAIQNRTAINSRIDLLKQSLTAEAANGASSRQLAKSLRTQRGALMDAGRAAGLSRKQLSGYLRTMGLTPKLVKTIIRQTGAEAAATRTRRLNKGYNDLPSVIKTRISEEGVPQTQAKVRQLKRDYGLTPKTVKTLMQLQSASAESGIKNVDKLLEGIDKKQTEPKVGADISAALGGFARVQLGYNNLPDSKTIVITTQYKTIGKPPGKQADGGPAGIMGPAMFAGGGRVMGPGGPRDDLIPTWLSNGEYVVNAASTAKYPGLVAAINDDDLARIASAMPRIPDTPAAVLPDRDWSRVRAAAPGRAGGGLSPADVDRIVRAIEENRAVAVPVAPGDREAWRRLTFSLTHARG